LNDRWVDVNVWRRNLIQLLSDVIKIGDVETFRSDRSLVLVVLVNVVRLQKLRKLSESRMSERKILFEMLGRFFESVGPVLFLGVNVVVAVSDARRRIN
jgi:hypothetical protein